VTVGVRVRFGMNDAPGDSAADARSAPFAPIPNRLRRVLRRLTAALRRPEHIVRRYCSFLRLALLLAVMLLVSSFTVSVVAAPQNLPDMGEPADSSLSPLEEQQLGAEFMRQIRAGLPLVRDVQLEEYIQALGMRLALASGKTGGQPFTFFIIDDADINAFAIPGGYVGINAGLIDAMQREEQLAGVVAHEVAHVTQRHHARAFATGNRASLSAAAAVLAAIVIGQASPEAGQAALAAGIAATQQSAINFTRSNEIEADRIGIEILANANYDARAMAESFSILRRRNTLNTTNSGLEYLRTHPLDNNRIAEAADRAVAKPRADAVSQIDFLLFKARLAVLTTEDAARLERAFRSLLSSDDDEAVGAAYALALLALRGNRLEEAATHLEQLAKEAPAHPMVALLQADLLEAEGRESESRRQLEDLNKLYPERFSIAEKRIEQLSRAGRVDNALDVSLSYLRGVERPDPLAWRQLASIRQQLGDSAGSHEALAHYFEAFDELERAESQFELALRNAPAASQDELRLQASLKAIREKAARRR